MSVLIITASIECDRCGKGFKVELDAAYKPSKDWAIWDVAEDAVRGGSFSDDEGLGSTSVQDGSMLCKACTKEIDSHKGPEDD